MLTMLELYRRARGWSQAALAELLGPGFTASAISLMEASGSSPASARSAAARGLRRSGRGHPHAGRSGPGRGAASERPS